MNKENILRKSVKGTLIVFVATGLQYIIVFCTQVALARILDPSHFGILAFASMVAMFFSNFSNLHGNKYIIKEKDKIQQKLNNVFTLELVLASLTVFLVIFIAPYLLDLLGKPELTRFVQLLVLISFYNPLSKPLSIFERDLAFFKAKFPMVLAQLIGGLITVSLAFFGLGIWSLILWRLIIPTLEALIIWKIIPTRPKLALNRKILKGVIDFGWPLLGSSILVFFYWNIDYYIVGSLLGKDQLGYYWLAFQVSHYFLKAKVAIMSVVYPAFARMDNERYIKKSFEILTKFTAIIYMLPTIIILVSGKELIAFIFGTKWLPATTVFKIFMVLITLRAVTSYWDPIFLYHGKTKFLFLLTILNSIFISVAGYFATKAYGIEGMASAVLLSIIMITPIAAFILKKLIDISYTKILSETILFATVLLVIYYVTVKYLSAVFQWGGELIGTILFVFLYGFVFYKKNAVVIGKILFRNV